MCMQALLYVYMYSTVCYIKLTNTSKCVCSNHNDVQLTLHISTSRFNSMVLLHSFVDFWEDLGQLQFCALSLESECDCMLSCF